MLDLTQEAKSFDDVCGWVTRAITDEATLQSLRYDWEQVTQHPCATAAEVAEVLRRHGRPGRPKPCSPGCPVQRNVPR